MCNTSRDILDADIYVRELVSSGQANAGPLVVVALTPDFYRSRMELIIYCGCCGFRAMCNKSRCLPLLTHGLAYWRSSSFELLKDFVFVTSGPRWRRTQGCRFLPCFHRPGDTKILEADSRGCIMFGMPSMICLSLYAILTLLS